MCFRITRHLVKQNKIKAGITTKPSKNLANCYTKTANHLNLLHSMLLRSRSKRIEHYPQNTFLCHTVTAFQSLFLLFFWVLSQGVPTPHWGETLGNLRLSQGVELRHCPNNSLNSSAQCADH